MRRFLVVLMCLFPAVALGQSSNDAGKPAVPFKPGETVAIPGPDTTTGSGSFTGSERTMGPGRFYRSGTPGEACAPYSSGRYQFRRHAFVTNASGTLTVTFDAGSCLYDGYVTFHTRFFNHESICDRYVWAQGSSGSYGPTSFTVPANTEIEMVVSGVTVNAPGVVCGPYTYTLEGTTASVPSMSQWGLIGLSITLAGGAAWMLMRRRRPA